MTDPTLDAIMAARMDGQTFREIGERLGIDPGEVQRMLNEHVAAQPVRPELTAVGFVARELATLLNHAARIGIAVVPCVDREGVDYSIESGLGDLTVSWDGSERKWKMK